MDNLVDAYISWMFPSMPDVSASQPTPQESDWEMPSDSDILLPYTLRIFDIFSLQTELTISQSSNSLSPALDFIRYGYLTKTLMSPNIALSLWTLEFYHRIRLCKPSLSAEVFAKVICDFYHVRISASSPSLLSQVKHRYYTFHILGLLFEIPTSSIFLYFELLIKHFVKFLDGILLIEEYSMHAMHALILCVVVFLYNI